MPTRQSKEPRVRVVADLDDIISEPIGFRFQGKVYVIEPVTAETFMKVANSLGKIENLLKLRGTEDLSDDKVYNAYYDFFHPVCPTLGLKEIRGMPISQLHALINLMIRHLTGSVDHQNKEETNQESPDSQKKKTTIIQ